jgi:hypothetical protein
MTLIAGCSKDLRIFLINNTGAEIRLIVDSQNVQIDQGQHATFIYPRERNDWKLKILVNGQEYLFAMPKTLEGYPWAAHDNTGVHAQIEPDLRIYMVLPSDVDVVNTWNRSNLCIAGFPLFPIKK